MSDAPLSLFELNKNIKSAMHSQFDDTYWVVAEISDITEARNGHCYLELIEKDEKNEQIIAKTRANIWSYTYRMLKPYFESTTGQNLASGIKIMIRASIDFQEVFGLSLNIRDIDPNYTLGDMAQKKQAILKQLDEEGVIDMNKETELPLVPQRIAIISSPTAAGYEDFINQIENNSYGIKFYTKLFPAIMQGDQTEESVIAALERIYEYEDFFDVVAIIRGGGSSSDLMAFDNYWIAYNIAQFPIPVFTGIGHERDESVVDFVAHTRLKTPTAVAEHIIEIAAEFDGQLQEYKQILTYASERILSQTRTQYSNNSSKLKPLVKNALLLERNKLDRSAHYLQSQTLRYIDKQKTDLLHKQQDTEYAIKTVITKKSMCLEQIPARLETRVNNYLRLRQSTLAIYKKTNELLDPQNVLKKGYSITYANGKALKNTQQVNSGDTITTLLQNGVIESTVSDKKS